MQWKHLEKASLVLRLEGPAALSVHTSAIASLAICKAWALLLADTPLGALFHNTLSREGLRIAMW